MAMSSTTKTPTSDSSDTATAMNGSAFETCNSSVKLTAVADVRPEAAAAFAERFRARGGDIVVERPSERESDIGGVLAQPNQVIGALQAHRYAHHTVAQADGGPPLERQSPPNELRMALLGACLLF